MNEAATLRRQTAVTQCRGAPLFTAAVFARKLGRSKQNVHQRLDDIPADGEQFTNGNRAKAWRIEIARQSRLFASSPKETEAKRYRTIIDHLRSPSDRCLTSPRFHAPKFIRPPGNARPSFVRRCGWLLPLRNDLSISAAESQTRRRSIQA